MNSQGKRLMIVLSADTNEGLIQGEDRELDAIAEEEWDDDWDEEFEEEFEDEDEE